MSIDVELTDLAYGGDAVGRYEGRVLFVPGGIPGERVRVEIVEERRGHARAELLEILRAAPERVEPPYPELTDSGCQWQHIAYPAQLTWKAHIVRQLLVRIGKQPDAFVHPTIGMPTGISAWHYRNIALFSVGAEGEVGFKLTESHEIQDLTDCALLHPALDSVYQKVRHKLIEYFGDTLGEMMQGFTLRGAIGAVATTPAVATAAGAAKAVPTLIVIHARPGSVIENPQQLANEFMTIAPGTVGVIIERVGGRYGRVFAGQEFLTDVIMGRRFRVSADSFFQVNLVQAGVLVERAIAMLEPQRSDVVLDGYSGVGLFSAFLSPRTARVIAIESQPSAVMDARANATLNNQSNITVLEGTLERLLGQLHYRREHIDIALVDPPRAGCHPKALQALQTLAPRAICYISCDPSTLARDSATLCSGGRYRLVAAQPIDMFPQTYHIECIALLARVGPK
ncbi:MAG: 23S rRNA (uracil(1939)-C(5))-methyltransferase RlmD [Chloroflexi bacterium]|nr:23S rRNA (uracil(1939)-C(5))-methyltransferase RlmD [Ktedonobacteraceae bacterium]MBV8823328.1 23S rRNA (uracil(1939)-C(5))-methyltransferase RlmD [Ktedonobacteraceae bacterium]MBV9019120.1 23S rRNA (uracil(1939)-C(5))-methyltransferase RlmD [Ktedonobacteraceae bacterium]MBV9707404.1 23S rRNA (uracil(1939)-C(5))-methyltransferase RlmD [Chloroflexota bacterium]